MRSYLLNTMLAMSYSKKTVHPITEECGFLFGGKSSINESMSAVVKFDFNLEISSLYAASLPRNSNDGVGISGSTKGYTVGGICYKTGIPTEYLQDVIFIEYATGSLQTQSVSLSKKRYGNNNHGLNSTIKGYISGTAVDSQENKINNSIDILNLITETLSATVITIPSSDEQGSSLSSNSLGYLVNKTRQNSVLTRLDFFDETLSQANSSLRCLFDSAAGVASLDRGYWLGYTGDRVTTQYVESLRFSDESVLDLSIKTHQSLSKKWSGMMSASKGFCLTNPNSDTTSSGVYDTGIDFITESSIHIRGGDIINSHSSAVSKYHRPRDTKGYIAGGIRYSSISNSVTGFDYKQETLFSLKDSLSDKLQQAAGVSAYNTNTGYIFGGRLESGEVTSIIHKISYFNDTVSPVDLSLSGLINHVGFQSEDVGYFTGGINKDIYDGIYNQSVLSIHFSTETFRNLSSSLSEPRTQAFSFNSQSKGIITGGMYSDTNNEDALHSSIESLDFFSAQISVSSQQLPLAINNGASVSSPFISEKGYHFGGSVSVHDLQLSSNIYVLDFNLDQAVYTINTGLGIQASTGIYSVSRGYFLGGISATAVNLSIKSLVFSNETLGVCLTSLNESVLYTASVTDIVEGYANKSDLLSIRGLIAGGGISSRFVSQIDGINFLTENSFSTSSFISHNYTCAVNNKTTGYMFGDNLANMSTIDFYTDSVDDKGQIIDLSLNKADVATFSSSTKGYFNALQVLPDTNTKNKYGCILYDTDAISILNVGLALQKYKAAGMCSATHGYTVGGHTIATTTKISTIGIDSLVLATETVELINSYLDSPRSSMSSLTYEDKGYLYKGRNYKPNDTYNAVTYDDLMAVHYANLTVMPVLANLRYNGEEVVNNASLNDSDKGYFCESGGALVVRFIKSSETVSLAAASLITRDVSTDTCATIHFKSAL